MDGKVLSMKDVKALADLPSKKNFLRNLCLCLFHLFETFMEQFHLLSLHLPELLRLMQINSHA